MLPAGPRILRVDVKGIAAATAAIVVLDNRLSGTIGIVPFGASIAVLLVCLRVWLICDLGRGYRVLARQSQVANGHYWMAGFMSRLLLGEPRQSPNGIGFAILQNQLCYLLSQRRPVFEAVSRASA
jgi:hypothetical protein